MRGGAVVGVRYVECWRDPRAGWDDLRVKQLQRLMGGLPDGVCKAVTRVCISSECFTHSPRHCPPSHSLPLSGAACKAVLWVGKKEMAGTRTAGKTRGSLMFLVSLWQKSMGQQGLSWQFVRPGESDTCKAKLLLLISSVYPISGFFLLL